MRFVHFGPIEFIGLLISVLLFILWAFALVNAVKRRRTFWIFVIALTHALGALAYILSSFIQNSLHNNQASARQVTQSEAQFEKEV